MKRGPWQVLIALDQLLNAIGRGSADETISSRAWKAKVRGKLWGRAAVALIDLVFGRGHCRAAVEWDE